MAQEFVNTVGTYVDDNLFAGGVANIVTGSVKLKAGDLYVRGAVLGINAVGTAELVTTPEDEVGDEITPYAILAEDVDATNDEMEAPVYLTGEFNERALTVKDGETVGQYRQALRNIGIFLKTNQEA